MIQKRRLSPIKSTFNLVSLVLLAFILSGCDELDKQSAVDSSQVVVRAESYLSQGQFRAASIEARKILQENPGNVDAHVIIARILLEIGQPLAAISQLEQLEDIKDPRYLLTLADAYIQRGKYYSAHEVLEGNRSALQSANDYKLNLLLAQTLQGLQQNDKAKRTYARAVELAGSNNDKKTRALIAQARFYMNQKDIATAEKHLDEALALGKHSEALLHKGSLAYKRGDYDQAEDYLSNALIELENTDIITPTKIQILKGLVETLTQSGRSSEALIYSKLLAEAAPNAEQNQNKFMKALKLYQDGKLEEAEKLLSEVYSGGANEYSGRMLGLINAIQGDLAEADTFLSEHIDPETASSKAIRVLAETKLRLNQTDEALGILEEKVAQSPNDPEIQSIYGLALLTAGQTDKAVDAIQKALAIQPDKPRLRVALAKIYMSREQFEKAREQLVTAYQSSPENEDVVVTLGKLYVASNNMKKARELSGDLLKQSPDSAFSHGFAGSIAFAGKDFDTAITHYKKARELDPNNRASQFGLARAYIGKGDYQQAITELQGVIESEPNSPQVYKAFVAAHELNKTVDQALKEIQLMADKDIQAWAPLTVLAEYQMRQRSPDQAVALVEQALTRNAVAEYPKNVALAAYHMSATKALQEGNYTKARELLLKGLQLAPDDIRFLAMLTATEMKSGQQREAEKILAQLENSHPGSPVGLELRGDIKVMESQLSEALVVYEQAWDKQPADSVGNKIYRIKAKLSNDPEAFLSTWQQKLPKSESAAILQAIEYQKANNTSAAISQYEKALELNPRSLTAINNLAWLKFEKGKSGALELAREGAQLYPQSAAMLDTYGWILVQKGQKTEGRKVLKKAHELAPDNEEIRKHYESAR